MCVFSLVLQTSVAFTSLVVAAVPTLLVSFLFVFTLSQIKENKENIILDFRADFSLK